MQGRSRQTRVRAAEAPEITDDEDNEATSRPAVTSTVVPLRQAPDAGGPIACSEGSGLVQPVSTAEQPAAAGTGARGTEREAAATRPATATGAKAPVDRRRSTQTRTEPASGRGLLLSLLLVAAAVAIVGWAASGFWPLGSG